jgi:hypothetical protein
MKKRISMILAAAAIGVAVVALARDSAVPVDAAAVQTPQTGQKGMAGMPMQDMAKMHEKMMAEMKAEQARLEELVTKMNSASGTAKVDAMAGLLTAIVQNHGKMIERMDMMHQHMMKMK